MIENYCNPPMLFRIVSSRLDGLYFRSLTTRIVDGKQVLLADISLKGGDRR